MLGRSCIFFHIIHFFHLFSKPSEKSFLRHKKCSKIPKIEKKKKVRLGIGKMFESNILVDIHLNQFGAKHSGKMINRKSLKKK